MQGLVKHLKVCIQLTVWWSYPGWEFFFFLCSLASSFQGVTLNSSSVSGVDGVWNLSCSSYENIRLNVMWENYGKLAVLFGLSGFISPEGFQKSKKKNTNQQLFLLCACEKIKQDIFLNFLFPFSLIDNYDGYENQLFKGKDLNDPIIIYNIISIIL